MPYGSRCSLFHHNQSEVAKIGFSYKSKSISLEIHYVIYGQVYDAVFFKYVALIGEDVGFGDIVTLVGDEFVDGTMDFVIPA